MRDNKGFTLIELLIVVVIIGILAAIAIPKFSATREKAFYSAMRSDLRNLASQQEIYYSDEYTYGTAADVGFVESPGITVTVSGQSGTGWAATAVHEGTDGAGCAVFHGDATAPAVPGGGTLTDPGAIVCADTAPAP